MNGKEVIAVLFNDKGELIKRSSLLLDEEEEVLNETSNDSIYNIDIVKSSRNKISFVNRSQKEKKNFLIKYINKENNLTNLKYLYYDYFEKEDDNINNIKKSLINEIKYNWNNKLDDLYETVKIFKKIKN